MPTYETYSTSLTHHGILGMKWGIRRYQNKDGSLTPEGRARYDKMSDKDFIDEMERKSNPWYVRNGKYSKKAYAKYRSDFNKKTAAFDKKYPDVNVEYTGKLTKEQLDDAIGKYGTLEQKFGIEQIWDDSGRSHWYAQSFLDTYGRDITYAQLKDFGFADEDAKKYTDRLIANGTHLVDWRTGLYHYK